MDLQITGLQFGIGTLCLAITVIGIILGVRQIIPIIIGKHKNESIVSPRKRSEVNILKSTSSFWRVGLICAIAFSILAFSWTTFEPQFDGSGYTLDLEDDKVCILFNKHQRNGVPPGSGFGMLLIFLTIKSLTKLPL